MALSYEEWKKQRLAEAQIKQQRSFAGEILPTAGAIGGGILGGIAGAAAAGVGAVPGAIAGAAAGGAGGEAIQQKIEKSFGQRQAMNPGQIAATGVTSAVLEATGAGIAKVAKPIAGAVRAPMVKLLSKFSGFTDDIVSKALSRSPGVVSTLQGGEKALNNIVSSANKKFFEFAGKELTKSKEVIAKIAKQESLGGPGETASRNLLLTGARDFVAESAKKLRTYNIGVKGNGTLLFDRVNKPSNIVAKADQSTIQEAFNRVVSIRENTSIPHIDAVHERLITLLKKTPAGSPTGAESKKIIQEFMGNIDNFVETNYPKYAEAIKENFTKRIFIAEAKDLLGDTANLGKKELAQLSKKMYQLYNTGNLPVREGMEAVGRATGEDVSGAAAGALMKAGEQFSVRAPQLTKRQIATKIVEYIPRKILTNFARTGAITGDLADNKVVEAISKITGISVKALIQEAVSLSQDKTSN